MTEASTIEKLDAALVDTSDRALIYAQIIEFAMTEFQYLGVFGDAETRARAKGAALYMRARLDGLDK